MAVSITSVDPPDLKIGGIATEVKIAGTDLKKKKNNLEAALLDAQGNILDKNVVLIEQPNNDDTTEILFPIMVTVLESASAGNYRVVIKSKTVNLQQGACPGGSACDIFNTPIVFRH